MKLETSQGQNSLRKAAIDAHKKLHNSGPSHSELGRFYRGFLAERLWCNGAELAEGLGISASKVSRAIAISRIPDEVISAIGGPDFMTIRLSKRIEALLKESSVEIVVQKAVQLGLTQFRSIEELWAAFSPRSQIQFPVPQVRLSLDKRRRFIRIESTCLAELATNLSTLEDLINANVRFWAPSNYGNRTTATKLGSHIKARRENAINQHNELKSRATLADYGRFYQAMLENGVWSSRREIAAALGLSKDAVGRRIALALVPNEVATAFGGIDSLSLRTAKTVRSLEGVVGKEQLRAKALRIPPDAKRSASETLALLAAC